MFHELLVCQIFPISVVYKITDMNIKWELSEDGGYNKSPYAFIKLNKELFSDIYYCDCK
jgi:hypothetical protein